MKRFDFGGRNWTTDATNEQLSVDDKPTDIASSNQVSPEIGGESIVLPLIIE
jgi:hypothetical protein